MAKRRMARLDGFGCQNTASTQCSAMLVAVDTDGVGWVQRWAPGATWERVDDLPDYEADPGPADPPVRPTEPEPGGPGTDNAGFRQVLRVPRFTLTAAEPMRLVELPAALDYVVECCAELPAGWLGSSGEVYLCGIPAAGGFQMFVRTKNRWACIGADQAWSWLAALSRQVGQPLESGKDGSVVAEGYAGWCGMRYMPMVPASSEVAVSVGVPGTGKPTVLQIGENREPKPGSHTRLPVGVQIGITVWAR